MLCLGIYSHSYKRRLSQNELDCFTKSGANLAKYIATINHEDVYADEQTKMFASHESLDHCSADCSLFACNICPYVFFFKKG